MSDLVDTAEAARVAGISPSTLRSWEERYGWPVPERRRNGHRMYTSAIVCQLAQVADAIARGHGIGDLLRTGEPVLPRREPPPSEQQATIAELHQQIALLREVALMHPHRRFTAEGERLVRVALHRSSASQSYLDRLGALHVVR